MHKNEPLTKDAYAILRRMKGGSKSRGFTIVETLVVIAITGVLFAAIVATLSGRQSRTEFTQSVQEIQSQIQQVISDVATGYYPNSNNFQCVAGLTGPQFSTGAVKEQGANEGCIFLGKAMQFKVAGTDPEGFNIYTIAGLQRTPAGNEVTSYAEAYPKAVAPPVSTVDLTEVKKLQYGLTTGSMLYSVINTPIGAVAFLNSLASYSDGGLVSGSHEVAMVPVGASALGQTPTQAKQALNTQLRTSPVNPSGNVRICFVSAGTNQSGLMAIGGGGRQLAVTLSIKGNKTCA
jgi:prepilin-type N-terminal cleavage/methylation domain-containing protein